MNRKPMTAHVLMACLSSTALVAEAGPCNQAAGDLADACAHEAREDFLTVAASCRNIEDELARADCLADAQAERDGLLAEDCPAQEVARRALCERLGDTRYDPRPDPADFLDPADIPAQPNPWFPLVPGNTWVYAGDGETITVTVTDESRRVMGIPVVTVRDVVRNANGRLIEDTLDWYAQHQNGDIWYMGELAKNYRRGRLVDLEGSWEAGREHAQPGILLKAAPQPGDLLRQEFLPGEAEDHAEVISITGTRSTPGGSCAGDCLVTEEGTPIEPDALERKIYAPGIGLILERDPESGDEVVLQSFTPGI